MTRPSLLEIHSMDVNEGTDQNLNFYAQLVNGHGKENFPHMPKSHVLY